MFQSLWKSQMYHGQSWKKTIQKRFSPEQAKSRHQVQLYYYIHRIVVRVQFLIHKTYLSRACMYLYWFCWCFVTLWYYVSAGAQIYPCFLAKPPSKKMSCLFQGQQKVRNTDTYRCSGQSIHHLVSWLVWRIPTGTHSLRRICSEKEGQARWKDHITVKVLLK